MVSPKQYHVNLLALSIKALQASRRELEPVFCRISLHLRILPDHL